MSEEVFIDLTLVLLEERFVGFVYLTILEVKGK